MPSIDVKKRRIDSKIVYYGPGQSGKTEQLRYIYANLEADHKGRLTSLPTKNDASLSIDVLPVRFGKIAGFQATFHLCSGPGLSQAVNTRRLLLRETDGIVFIADSRPARADANIDSLQELREVLGEYGLQLAHVPHVIAYNKRDLPDAVDITELRATLNTHGVPDFEASAVTGQGVMDALRTIVRAVGDDLQQRL